MPQRSVNKQNNCAGACPNATQTYEREAPGHAPAQHEQTKQMRRGMPLRNSNETKAPGHAPAHMERPRQEDRESGEGKGGEEGPINFYNVGMSSLSPLKIVTALTINAADVAAIFGAFVAFMVEIDELRPF